MLSIQGYSGNGERGHPGPHGACIPVLMVVVAYPVMFCLYGSIKLALLCSEDLTVLRRCEEIFFLGWWRLLICKC